MVEQSESGLNRPNAGSGLQLRPREAQGTGFERGWTTVRGRLALLAGILAIAVIAAYGSYFDNDFQFDDSHVIVDNLAIRDLSNLPRFFTDSTTFSALPTNFGYRPVLLTTFAVDYAVGAGLDPFMFRLTGLLIHLGVAALAAVLFRRVIDTAVQHRANPFVAVVLAGLFALHTANAETVNYVSARSDSLSTLFVLAAMVIWTGTSGSSRHYAYLPLVAGILVKPSAVVFVPLLVAYELLFRDTDWLEGERLGPSLRRVVRRVVPASIVTLWFALLVIVMTPSSSDTGGGPLWDYVITQPFVVFRYFWTFFLPLGLTADSDWTTLTGVADWRFLVGATFIAIAVAVIILAARRKVTRPIAFGVLWFLIAQAPTSLVPLAEVTNDHRMYLPFVGLTLAVGWSVALVVQRHEAMLRASRLLGSLAVGVLVLVLGAHVVGTWQRSQVWDTQESLWLDVTRKSPANGRGLMNYGNTQMAHGRYEVALDYYQRALATDYGNHPYLFVNLGLASNGLGHIDQAESYFREAIQRGPGFPATHYHYAQWLSSRGRVAEAVPFVHQALALSPGHAPAMALSERISSRMALVTAAEEGVAADPGVDSFIELSFRYYDVGLYQQAADAAESALAFDPDSSFALNNLCVANIGLGRYEEAVDACTAALAIDPDFELAQNNLAWALEEMQSPGG